MKVVYRSVLDEIRDANDKAKREGRTIKKIVLNHSEKQEFIREMTEALGPRPLRLGGPDGHLGRYDGINVYGPGPVPENNDSGGDSIR